MKVRMKTTARGSEFSANAGDVIDVDKDTAKELLNGGYAEPVGVEVETTTEPEPDEAAEEKPRKNRPKRSTRKKSS